MAGGDFREQYSSPEGSTITAPGDAWNSAAVSAEAMFVVDEHQRIVGWNGQASALLGSLRRAPLGAACYEVVAATDHAGRPFCTSDCPVIGAAREGRALATLKLAVGRSEGRRTPVEMSTILIGGRGRVGGIIHLLRPASEEALPADSEAGVTTLTRRERQILNCLCRGDSTTAMARKLEISTTTVRNHVQHVLEKLSVHSRAEAVAAAHRIGVHT